MLVRAPITSMQATTIQTNPANQHTIAPISQPNFGLFSAATGHPSKGNKSQAQLGPQLKRLFKDFGLFSVLSRLLSRKPEADGDIQAEPGSEPNGFAELLRGKVRGQLFFVVALW